MKMKINTLSNGKLAYCVKAPMRVLRRARDCYVNSMNDYAGRVNYGPTVLPKSFSVSSSRLSGDDDEDTRTLIRLASQRHQRERSETTTMRVMPTVVASKTKGLPKSFSVGMGRIDEDEPSDFQEDFKLKSPTVLYPRSRSYAVANRRVGLQSY